MSNLRKRFLAAWIVLLEIPIILGVFAFFLPPQYTRTYLAGLYVKKSALQAAEDPKIVIIGGSGTAFGLRSDLLEEEFPERNVVNFGLYAGLGTTVMLDLAKPTLRENDIVIFSPELSSQTLSAYLDGKALWQAADGHFSVLSGLSTAEITSLASSFCSFAADKARCYFTGSAPLENGIYGAASFTSQGDILPGLRPGNIMPGGADENMPLSFDPEMISPDFTASVNAFDAYCRSHGIRFYYWFCPMNAAAVKPAQPENLSSFTHALAQQLSCPILGNSQDAQMASGWFYDTNFHLNDAGALVNTARLAADLKKELGNDPAVSFALPSMPDAAEITLVDGDNTDADCFTWDVVENTLCLTGLSTKGQTRTALILPAVIEGLPVRTLSPSLFQGNTRLQSVTIQPNIVRIPDRSFAGCSSLEIIRLLHESPSACTVGRKLLEGTDANVLVPPAAVSTYCTDYFWSAYADRISADFQDDVHIPETVEDTVSETAVHVAEESVSTPSAFYHLPNQILYDGNGGTARYGEDTQKRVRTDRIHQRQNTLQGTTLFVRDNYVLTGWNTKADASGKTIGLGSRTAGTDTLYAVWEKSCPLTELTWESDGRYVSILAWKGNSASLVLPERINNLPVTVIKSGAVSGRHLDRLVLPSSLQVVEEGAFSDCTMDTVVLFDGIRSIQDASFLNCSGPKTLCINACTRPVYAKSYFATFADKYDTLLAIQDQKKIVLFSGSSGRYGYDTPKIIEAFPGYTAVNMGVYAWTGARAQLEIIQQSMKSGDILLSAPEFDAVEYQFALSSDLDASFFAMMEENYDALRDLDLRSYTAVFDSLGSYLTVRSKMEKTSYTDTPANYDDDGRYYAFSTYNLYGDLILPRENADTDERLRHNIADYTVDSFPDSVIDCLNRVYQSFLEKDITVLFTYTPRNVNSLTEKSTPEARALLHEQLVSRLCVPVITPIEAVLYPGRYFWLIDSHTSTEGTKLRTEQVIADLKAWGLGTD